MLDTEPREGRGGFSNKKECKSLNNPYAYAGGNPICKVDPLGLRFFTAATPAFSDRHRRFWFNGKCRLAV